MNKPKTAAHFRVPKYPEVERKFLDYVVEYRAQGLVLSTVHLQLQAKLIAKDLEIDRGSFTASPNWCYGFMRQNELSVIRQTRISKQLPMIDRQDKLLTFQQFVTKKETRTDAPSLHVWECSSDASHLRDISPECTIHMKGGKTVTMQTTGKEKNPLYFHAERTGRAPPPPHHIQEEHPSKSCEVSEWSNYPFSTEMLDG